MLALLTAAGCSGGSTGDANRATTTTVPLAKVKSAFCDDLGAYVKELDTYGRVFSEPTLTVGVLRDNTDKLKEGEAKVKASADELATALEATNTAATMPGTTTVPATTTTILARKSADDHLNAIAKAEKNLDQATTGIDRSTQVKDAVAEVHAAAFGVEQAYTALFIDAGCLKEDDAAARAVSQYVVGLQQDLTTLGLYGAAVDGIYGPETVGGVKALQKSVGLPQTGVVDPATEKALDDALTAKGQQKVLNIAALQGALAAAGVYSGPIDGQWSEDVEAAVKAYQTQQNLPPTGQIDPATLDALLNRTPKPPASSPTTTAAPTTATTKAPTAPATSAQ